MDYSCDAKQIFDLRPTCPAPVIVYRYFFIYWGYHVEQGIFDYESRLEIHERWNIV
jgi:hypothetical protein